MVSVAPAAEVVSVAPAAVVTALESALSLSSSLPHAAAAKVKVAAVKANAARLGMVVCMRTRVAVQTWHDHRAARHLDGGGSPPV